MTILKKSSLRESAPQLNSYNDNFVDLNKNKDHNTFQKIASNTRQIVERLQTGVEDAILSKSVGSKDFQIYSDHHDTVSSISLVDRVWPVVGGINVSLTSKNRYIPRVKTSQSP